VRYAPGDLSSWSDQPCTCGRTSARLNPLAGWIGQAVKVRGMFVHPSQLATVMASRGGIEAYRLVCRKVDQRDHLTLSYEGGEGSGPVLEQVLAQAFKDLCRLNLDAIERVASGTLPRDGKLVIDDRPQGEK
jgi:phenylacetate-CoA ligase